MQEFPYGAFELIFLPKLLRLHAWAHMWRLVGLLFPYTRNPSIKPILQGFQANLHVGRSSIWLVALQLPENCEIKKEKGMRTAKTNCSTIFSVFQVLTYSTSLFLTSVEPRRSPSFCLSGNAKCTKVHEGILSMCGLHIYELVSAEATMGCMLENPNPKTYSYVTMLNLVPEAYWG